MVADPDRSVLSFLALDTCAPTLPLPPLPTGSLRGVKFPGNEVNPPVEGNFASKINKGHEKW